MQQVGSAEAASPESGILLSGSKRSKLLRGGKMKLIGGSHQTNKMFPESSNKKTRERCYLRRMRKRIRRKDEDEAKMAKRRIGCNFKSRPFEFGLRMLISGLILIASISSLYVCETMIYQNQLFRPPSSLVGKSLSQVQQNSGKFRFRGREL